jgi:hypothetical protein
MHQFIITISRSATACFVNLNRDCLSTNINIHVSFIRKFIDHLLEIALHSFFDAGNEKINLKTQFDIMPVSRDELIDFCGCLSTSN